MSVDKKNIFLTDTREVLAYRSKSNPITTNYPVRTDFSAHASFIERKMREARNKDLSQRQVAAIRYKTGLYLEIVGQQGCELCTKSLDNRTEGIKLLNVREEENTTKATVYIPAGKENYFLDKIEGYVDSLPELPEGKNPKNGDLINSIEDIQLAVLSSFWIGAPNTMPTEVSVWCEIWLRNENGDIDSSEEDFFSCCAAINEAAQQVVVEVNSRRIVFPERVVHLIKANGEVLSALLRGCDFIAEIRRAPEATSFFDDLSAADQREWVGDLLSRTTFNESNATVCILDTGLAEEHPLIAPATKHEYIQAADSSWSTRDTFGHGTEMSGVSLYPNLKEALISDDPLAVNHTIESVKILPPHGDNPPDLYGAITEQAVSLAEIANPHADRTICMAVTTDEYNTDDGSPTSWSAAIDSITSGAIGDDEKRLFLISAGNVIPEEVRGVSYPDANINHSVENPGQSWNGVTVGAFTKDIAIEDEVFKGFQPVADNGQLSPYSATSVSWSKKWPIKPEVLFDGGNIATNGDDFSDCPDLSLLTTGNHPEHRLFTTFNGTSSATAQASHMAAQIFNEYPGVWPETVRALMIHSAQWTPKMMEQFCQDSGKSTGRKRLLHACGYGIPNLSRAIQCMNNSVNMIIQGEIQPYKKEDGRVQMNEMHIHEIPWPSDLLESMGDTEVEMRVTLSYFIEPGPGEIGWKDRYRYPSAGLRFDVKNTGETLEEFKARINHKMRDDDDDEAKDRHSGSDRWFLGPMNRDVGSIHSDYMRLNAIDLSKSNYIGVYPVIGWWKERGYLGKYSNSMRYSLVVSLSTPEVGVDFYTPIVTQIANAVAIDIPTP